jgi:hypothetical protein
MRRYLFFLVLLLTVTISSPVFASDSRYEYIGTTAAFNAFFDTKTTYFNTKTKYVEGWIRHDYTSDGISDVIKRAKKVGYYTREWEEFTYTLTYNIFDIQNPRSMTTKVLHYTAEGKLLKETKFHKPEWWELIPQSIGETTYAATCAYALAKAIQDKPGAPPSNI